MKTKELTGIERELVIKYLIDGNVPVTITPVIEKKETEIKAVQTLVLPIAVKGEKVSVLEEGIVFLQNPPESIKKIENENIKVEFYFNRVGLFFNSVLKSSKYGSYIIIPDKIERIESVAESKKYDFSAILYYSVNSNENLNFLCVPANNFNLFTRPVWSSIALENQKEAKSYLENFVISAKKSKTVGTGIQLINVCKYLVENNVEEFQEVEGLVKPFKILFVDHERILLAFSKNDSISLDLDKEYALKMSFSLSDKKTFTRDIFVTIKVCSIYSNDKNTKFCADCSFSQIQNEDLRFLYEKTTSSLFI